MLTTWPVGHVEAGLFETLTRQLSQHMWVSKVATCLGWTPACALRTDNVALRDSPMAANVSGGKRCPDFAKQQETEKLWPWPAVLDRLFPTQLQTCSIEHGCPTCHVCELQKHQCTCC